VANPLATMLSVGMMFRYSFGEGGVADQIDAAVSLVLDSGLRTGDIISDGAQGQTLVGTDAMADAVLSAFSKQALSKQ
jgi:3-isopropylmalate dehydrogenase